MLRVTQSNRLEELSAALAEALPSGDPFARATIVVSGRLVARWLWHDLARRRGVAGNLDLPFLEPFLSRTFAAPGLIGLDRAQVAALVASALASPLLDQPVMRPALIYINDDPVRRVQLANKVAGLLWDYALTRPDWLDAWDEGREADTGEVDRAALAWQSRLYAAIASPGRALVPRLPRARARLGLPPPSTGPVYVIGFSYLARAYLDALASLARTSPVEVLMVTPCAEYWEDVGGRRVGRGLGRRGVAARAEPERLAAGVTPAAAENEDDPLALAWWGAPGRDTAAGLLALTDGDVTERHVEPTGTSALALWSRDVLHRALPPSPGGRGVAARAEPDRPDAGATPAPADHDVTVLACPSLARELEIVGSTIWQHLRADETLHATEIAVLIAGDPERYVAQVGPVFGALHRLPFHIVDAPAKASGRVAEAALALLELGLGRCTRREVLGLMTHPAMLARHPQIDPADWARWCERLGIAHGADDRDHEGTYLAGAGAFHWSQGIARLALGAFVAEGPSLVVSALGREILPEPVSPDQEASASTFVLLARSLLADARWLRERAEPLARWAQILPALIESYLGETEAEGVARARVIDELGSLADLDLDNRAVPYREVVELVKGRLAQLREGRGEALAHGVRVARLEPMRPIPARLTFIVGLGEGVFPAGDPPSPLDLRSGRRRGDVAPRDRDRYGFLEALGAARGPVYLSYVARDEQSGDQRAPSSVVHELTEMLAPYGATNLTIAHPLRRWDEAYLDDPRLVASASPGAARERHALIVRRSLDEHLRSTQRAAPDAPELRVLLAAPALDELRRGLRLDLADGTAPASGLDADDAPVTVSLAVLRRFLEQPVQAWAQVVLGLDSADDDDGADREDEPFEDTGRDRIAVLREVFGAVLAGEALDQTYAQVRRRRELAGQAPLGPFGEAARRRDLERLARWQDELARSGGLTGPWTRIAFGRATVHGADLRPALGLDATIRGRARRVEIVGTTELCGGPARERTLVLVNKEPSEEHLLRGAIDHLVLAAAGLTGGARSTLVLGESSERRNLAPWTEADARAHLALLVGELYGQHHAYYLSLASARAALEGKRKPPPREGESLIPVLGYGPIDRNPGLGLPKDAFEIAKRRLGPIEERSEKPKKEKR